MDLYLLSGESPKISFAQASRNIKKALSLDDEEYYAHLALAQLYMLRGERDKAITALERAIALYPNGSEAYAHLGWVLSHAGEAEEGIKLIEKAMRLNPIPPVHYLQYLAEAYSNLGRHEDAIEVYKKLLQRSPDYLFAHTGITCNFIASGREEEAHQQAQEILRLDPAFSVDKYAENLMLVIEDKAEAEQWIEALRKAGLK
jgi:adenylate cyclase